MPLMITGGLGNTAPWTGAFQALQVQAGDKQLVITFNVDTTISGPAASPSGYSVTTGDVGVLPVTITSVAVAGPIVTLGTTMQTYNANYVLNFPVVGLVSVDGRPFNGPFTFAFSGGAATPVAVQMVTTIDARTLDVSFSRAVVQADASNPNNYTVTPTLAVHSATRITDFVYRIKTDRQVQGRVYSVSIANIGGL